MVPPCFQPVMSLVGKEILGQRFLPHGLRPQCPTISASRASPGRAYREMSRQPQPVVRLSACRALG